MSTLIISQHVALWSDQSDFFQATECSQSQHIATHESQSDEEKITTEQHSASVNNENCNVQLLVKLMTRSDSSTVIWKQSTC